MILKKCASIEDLNAETERYDAVEIQLLPAYDSVKPSDFRLKFVYSVHSLLDSSEGYDVDIADMRDYNLGNIYKAFKFADAIGEQQGNKVGVVLHSALGYSELIKYGLLQQSALRLGLALTSFKNTFVLIENGITASTDGFDMSKVVDGLLQELGNNYADRVFSVLDTTHALISSKMLTLDGSDTREAFEDYFKGYSSSGYCREIHFANCIGWGKTPDTHGVDFRNVERDKQYFGRLCQLVHQYLPNANICVEVRENNYIQPKAYSHIYNMLRSWVPNEQVR